MRSLVVGVVASTCKSPLPQGMIDRASRFSKTEEEVLLFLAPYAAELAPALAQDNKTIFAWGFVGFFGISTFSACRALKRVDRDLLGLTHEHPRRPDPTPEPEPEPLPPASGGAGRDAFGFPIETRGG